MVLKQLIDKGLEGDELVARYRQELIRARYDAALIKDSEEDITAGRLEPFAAMQERMRMKYDL